MEVVCPKCNSLNPVSSNFCSRCGASLASANVVRGVEHGPERTVYPPREISYYSADRLQVTSTRAVLGIETYPMANITSATVVKRRANRLAGGIIFVVGVIVLGVALNSDNGACIAAALAPLLIGIIMAAVQKNKYVVRIWSVDGKTDALTSTNKDQIEAIVSAVNQAIYDRG